MYVLTAVNGKVFYLVKLESTVGRKDCDLLLTRDQSISRLHAKIYLRNNKPMILDNGSKYGTYVNSQKLTANTEVELKPDDSIRFGQLRSFYKLKKITIVTTTSSIRSDKKKDLINNLSFLGGSLLPNWTGHCTHVTVEEILLTIKVLSALIKGIPIVNLKYWEDYVSHVKNNLPLPKVEDYKPECSEVTLGRNVQLDFKSERLTLFNNKIFVFPTRNEKAKMIDMITLAGGKAISWDDNPFTTEDLYNSREDYVLLEMGNTASENIGPALTKIINYNTKLGRRTVPVQEVALALINCSCEKDCNPMFDRKGTVLALKSQKIETQHPENILAMSTQTQNSVFIDEFRTADVIQHTEKIEIIEEKVAVNVEIKNGITENVMDVDQTTSFKRENETDETTLFSVLKKLKVDSSISLTSINGNQDNSTSTTEPSRKSKFSFKGDINLHNQNPMPEIINPFTKKRKGGEVVDDVDNTAKRPAVLECSAGSLPSTRKTINPFSLIAAKKLSGSSKNTLNASNSESSLSNYDQNAVSSTFVNSNMPNSLRIDISAIIPVDLSVLQNHMWLSKSRINETKNITRSTCVPEDVDEEVLKYVESFRNLVVIKEESMVVRRSSTVSNTSHNTSLANGTNFKKFKKVQPLNIQTTIIPESSYIGFICNG